MNKIEKLISELCPDGVEFGELGELGEFYSGLSGKSKADFSDGNAKFVTYMNIFSNIAVDTNIDTLVKIDKNEKQNKIEYGDVLFTGSSETPDECGMSSVLTKKVDEPLYLNSFCFGFRLHDIGLFLPEFLKYLFRDEHSRKQIAKTASGVTRFNVSKKRFAKILIPIPPLAVQQEIVKILDTFTTLEAELEAELEARKKQYEYYLEKEVNNISWPEKTLLDMLSQPITDGPHETPSFVDQGVPFISAEAIYDGKIDLDKKRGYITKEYDDICARKYKPQKEDVYMVKSGSTTGKVAIVNFDKDFNIWSPIAAMRVNKFNSSRFLYHLLKSKFVQRQVEKKASLGSQPNLGMRVLEKFVVRVPSLDEQNRIAELLDKFDALVNDISIGLPAELNARRKQYEYYRDKLLTFRPLKNENASE
jgi:type I restriction enzyme S subunit